MLRTFRLSAASLDEVTVSSNELRDFCCQDQSSYIALPKKKNAALNL